MTPRVRVLVMLTVACFVGWVSISWGFVACEKIADYLVNRGTHCSSDWRDWGNGGCGGFFGGTSYNVVLGIVEVMACVLILLVLGWSLTRWALRPFREMGEAIAQFGPTSLGLRIGRARTGDESGQLAASIDTMLDRVAEGYEAQRHFAANASHELRTPLATQRALIEVSLANTLTPDQQHLLARQLLSTNERNESLIEGLLVLAETERGLMARTQVRLDVLAADAVALHRVAAEEAKLSVTTELEEAAVPGEPALLERMVANLVQNAIKYNEPGGWVRVEVRFSGELIVANSGPAVSAEQVPALFEPFRRLGGERLEHSGGVGLGLTIVRSIVAAHHGTVTAAANGEGGLTVTVSL
ncbi:MAG TPA: HAMP domain-containing sensor histidine kinase [Jatrophihabitans sp.]